MLGLIHMGFVRGSAVATLTEALADRSGLMSTIGAVLVWVVMTTVISMLVRQAVVFARLGAHVTIVEAESQILPGWSAALTAPVAVDQARLPVIVFAHAHSYALDEEAARLFSPFAPDPAVPVSVL